MFVESIWGIQNNIWESSQRVHHVWEEYLCAVVIIYNPRLEHLHFTGGWGWSLRQKCKDRIEKTDIVQSFATYLLAKKLEKLNLKYKIRKQDRKWPWFYSTSNNINWIIVIFRMHFYGTTFYSWHSLFIQLSDQRLFF